MSITNTIILIAVCMVIDVYVCGVGTDIGIHIRPGTVAAIGIVIANLILYCYS